MTSDAPTEAYVWIWLPDATEPVVGGRLDRSEDRYVFSYGRSYLERADAVAIYALTPAYDVSPQPRSGEVARHPRFGESDSGREGRIAALVDAAPNYHLTIDEGREIAERQVDTIHREWDEVCDAAGLTTAQRDGLLKGPILNPYAFYE